MQEPADAVREDAASHWRPVLVLGVIVALALVVPVLMLPQTSALRAGQTSAEYRDALLALQADVAATDDVVELLTDPATEESEFAEALLPLSELAAHAEAARRVTSRRSLSPWPLAPAAPLQALAPTRTALEAAAPAADTIVTDLIAVLNYRAAYARMLDLEEMPSVAPLRFSRFKNQLEEMAEEELALLDELPSPHLMREHRSAVSRAVRGMGDWVEDYWAALWIGDEPTIERLLRELALLRLELDANLTARLAAIRSDVGAQLGELAAVLEEALSAVES